MNEKYKEEHYKVSYTLISLIVLCLTKKKSVASSKTQVYSRYHGGKIKT